MLYYYYMSYYTNYILVLDFNLKSKSRLKLNKDKVVLALRDILRGK